MPVAQQDILPPHLIAWVFWILVVLGILASLYLVVFPRGGAGGWWRELAPKVLSECVQWGCGVVAAWGAYRLAGEAKANWWNVVFSAFFCQLTWKAVQHLSDYQGRTVARNLAAELEQAEQEGQRRTRLLSTLGECVAGKLSQITRILGRLGPTRRQIDHLRDALTPDSQIPTLLNGLASLLLDQALAQGFANPAFRIGVYIERDGVLEPMYTLDTRRPGVNPFSSYAQHRAYFLIEGVGQRAHAVLCVRQKSMLIVEDCKDSQSRGEFVFFQPEQEAYLRSMVADYLGQIQSSEGTMKPVALVIDTPLPGFFQEVGRDSLTLLLREFSRRISLEMHLADLLRSPETNR